MVAPTATASPPVREDIIERLPEEEPARGPYAVRSRVTHPEWGEGTVLRYEGERMTVLFDSVGYTTLSVPVVAAQGLLT